MACTVHRLRAGAGTVVDWRQTVTYEIGDPITIKPGDIGPYDTFRATRELMERIMEAENRAIKEEIEANTVVINGRKYGMIKDKPGLLPTIFGMRVETSADMPDDWDFFIQQRPPMVLTNADRIRGMSDEELARFLPEIRNALTCVLSTDEGCPRPDDPCSDCWLDWLKSPAVEVDE